MILHIIMLNERNSYNLFHQMYEYLDMKDHVFLVADFKSNLKNFPKFEEFENFEYMDAPSRLLRIKKLYDHCKKADHIILNSLIYKSKKYLLFFYIFRKFLKKATWIEWGADLYDYKIEDKKPKSRFINHINKVIRRSVQNVGLTFEGDEFKYREEFPEAKPNFFFTPLPFGDNRVDLMEEAMAKAARKPEESLHVQVCHNSLQVNNHYWILMALSKFIGEDMNITLPLSYGTFGIGGQYGGVAYLNAVKAFARNMFPKRTNIIEKNMPIENYIEYLATVDIAVMGCERPIALANIYYLLYMGKKVFLPENSAHYKIFKEMGYNVFPLEDIDKMSWEEFSYLPDVTTPERLKDKFTVGKEILYWQKLFDAVTPSSDD
ncbi:MAG: TDP-N-acetylfucosamine:lipid II N-acetylfucosaminyltransferase [Oscillospiraceae bacterium]